MLTFEGAAYVTGSEPYVEGRGTVRLPLPATSIDWEAGNVRLAAEARGGNTTGSASVANATAPETHLKSLAFVDMSANYYETSQTAVAASHRARASNVVQSQAITQRR